MKKPSHASMTNSSPMYIYATEMVASYYSRINLNNKRVLSVIGSGDQVINACFFGAKEVVGFDINKRATHILNLKIAACIYLSYKEFFSFFGRNFEDGNLDFKLYSKFRLKMPVSSRAFFDKIYKEFSFKGLDVIRSEYFRDRRVIKVLPKEINAYLSNENNYLKCRSILQKNRIKTLVLDINDIDRHRELKGKFDVIGLSNVLNYVTGNTEDEDLFQVLFLIFKKIKTRLSNKGEFFYYSYSNKLYKNNNKAIPPASRLDLISELCQASKLMLLKQYFKGVLSDSFDRINRFKLK